MHVVPGADLVAAVGADAPSATRSSSHSAALHAGVEQRVVDEVEPLGDRLEVLADLLAERVARRRDVVHLLEHRHVDVRLDVAHHARVAVPVPGAADAAGLVDRCGCDRSRPCAAGRRRRRRRCPPPMITTSTSSATGSRSVNGVNGSSRYLAKCSSCAQVADVGPARHQALVALGQVLRPDRLRIEARALVVGCHHRLLLTSIAPRGNHVSAPVMSMRGARWSSTIGETVARCATTS